MTENGPKGRKGPKMVRNGPNWHQKTGWKCAEMENMRQKIAEPRNKRWPTYDWKWPKWPQKWLAVAKNCTKWALPKKKQNKHSMYPPVVGRHFDVKKTPIHRPHTWTCPCMCAWHTPDLAAIHMPANQPRLPLGPSCDYQEAVHLWAQGGEGNEGFFSGVSPPTEGVPPPLFERGS